jgi:hypothetical protein
MPLEASVDAMDFMKEVLKYDDAVLYKYDNFSNGIFVITSRSTESASYLFDRLMSSADIPEGDMEPRINLFSWWTGDEYRTIVYFRRCHRSHHYFSDGPDHLTMSPGCADMAGIFIVPVEEEYHKITPELLSEMIEEIKKISEVIIERNIVDNYVEYNKIKNEIREELGKYLYHETECKPMIIAVVQEV